MAEWSIDELAERLIEAARTAHRLPPVRVQGYFNVWPTIVRTEFERMACDDPAPIRFPPSPADVDRMLEVMRWVQCLDLDQRHLVWMRAERYRWSEIAKRFGCASRTAQRRWDLAMHILERHLASGN
ncbi:DUF6362 family protein [Pandoraea pnomenusa]|uniref:DUF6362 family protein n=1 Tax=Pandoraea pnomenusa TaxID=93220 RepID=UPI0003D1CE37|nr:DUF6362 family protein [Pandoraea pnomenusa]AHB77264.1 RNA polymerase subunit sigma [Pandoraea pnomenusa]